MARCKQKASLKGINFRINFMINRQDCFDVVTLLNTTKGSQAQPDLTGQTIAKIPGKSKS